MTRISIEGLIGLGKTTALSILESRYRVVYEPLDSWTLLTQFYEQKTKYAYPFEIQILCSYCHTQFDVPSDGTLLMERSPDSALHVFAKSLYIDQHLTTEQYQMIEQCYQTMPLKKADAIVFLDLDPQECLQRILERNRNSETTISLDVLEKLRQSYLDFLRESQIPHVIVQISHAEAPTAVAQRIEAAIRSLSLH
jgi:deoxyadenosine/deoxycytidine kinase